MGKMKFIDSFQFMVDSLPTLTGHVYSETNDTSEHFHFMKSVFPDHIDSLCRKGFYPYEWFDNNNKFNH